MRNDALEEKLRSTEKLLREIRVPGFDADIITLGVVTRYPVMGER